MAMRIISGQIGAVLIWPAYGEANAICRAKLPQYIASLDKSDFRICYVRLMEKLVHIMSTRRYRKILAEVAEVNGMTIQQLEVVPLVTSDQHQSEIVREALRWLNLPMEPTLVGHFSYDLRTGIVTLSQGEYSPPLLENIYLS